MLKAVFFGRIFEPKNKSFLLHISQITFHSECTCKRHCISEWKQIECITWFRARAIASLDKMIRCINERHSKWSFRNFSILTTFARACLLNHLPCFLRWRRAFANYEKWCYGVNLRQQWTDTFAGKYFHIRNSDKSLIIINPVVQLR